MPNYSSQNARTDKGSALDSADAQGTLRDGTLASGNPRKISEGDFIVTDVLVKIGEQRSGFSGNHGGFAVGSGKGVDAGK